MDAETLWIVKKLAAREISVLSADRILRALQLLREIEKAGFTISPETKEQNAASVSEKIGMSKIGLTDEDKGTAISTRSKPNSEMSLLDDNGIGMIGDIADGTQLTLEKSGDAAIQGWDENYIKAEGKTGSATILRMGKSLRISSEDFTKLYIPPAIEEINIVNGSGSIDVRNHPNRIVIDSDIGKITISEVDGPIKVNSFEGDITLENCYGEALLESNLGNITIRKKDKTHNISNGLSAIVPEDILTTEAVNIETGSGYISITDISSDIDVKTSSGDITLERCRGRSINIESSGGDIILTDLANNMSLKNENGNIALESFSGSVSVRSRNTSMSIKNSDGAKIHIESDSGDINIENCNSDIYIDSGSGDVSISGCNLSADSMARLELRMKSGNAYIHQRTFENFYTAIEEGNVRLVMDKLKSDGSGQISVYKGNITVGVLPDFGCELTVRSSLEEMYIELPLEIMEKDKSLLQGIVNNGGSKLELIAPNGEVRLHAMESSQIQSDVRNTVL